MKRKIVIPILLLTVCTVLFAFNFKENIQLVKTTLRITVLNDLGTAKEEVKVSLFSSDEDYRAGKNIVQEGMTDSKGRVNFKDLESKVYWVRAAKGDLNNDGMAVQTDTLQARRLNQATIIIN